MIETNFIFICDMCGKKLKDFEIHRFNEKVFCYDCMSIAFGHSYPKPKTIIEKLKGHSYPKLKIIIEKIKGYMNLLAVKFWYFIPK